MFETIQLKRDCEAIAIPSGRRKMLPAGTVVNVVQKRDSGLTVSTADHAMYRIDSGNADAMGFEAPTGDAEQPQSLNEKLVWDTLRTVYDPELPVNIVELGLIYSCAIEPIEPGGNRIVVRMTMTAPGCGMSDVLRSEVESKLARLPEVVAVQVEVVFDPPWTPNRISETARMQLGIDTGSGPSLIQLSRSH